MFILLQYRCNVYPIVRALYLFYLSWIVVSVPIFFWNCWLVANPKSFQIIFWYIKKNKKGYQILMTHPELNRFLSYQSCRMKISPKAKLVSYACFIYFGFVFFLKSKNEIVVCPTSTSCFNREYVNIVQKTCSSSKRFESRILL